MNDWITCLFEHKELLEMGHLQRADDLNLGLGWLYYSMVRVVRPSKVVVIGSYRGFTPLVFGKALADNVEGGTVCFIDPSFVDSFWRNPQEVQQYFAGLGVTNIQHFLMTTQQFVESEGYRSLGEVGVVFIDGYHSEEQARFDYEAFEDLVPSDGMILFHDSVRICNTEIYGPDQVYEHRVKCFIDKLKERLDLQVLDLSFGGGVTLVRKVAETEVDFSGRQDYERNSTLTDIQIASSFSLAPQQSEDAT